MGSDPARLGRVLVIAGSDSGGGAGIQADIKAVMAGGGYAMTAITAITAQNTLGVQGVWPVPIEAVLAQIDVPLSDIGVDAVKTGMLATAPLIEAVAERLSERASGVPSVIDPVMVATSGDRLVNDKAIDAMRSELVPGAALVTPNAPEAEVLTGKAVEDVNGQRRAAEALLERGALGALVKGGHIGGSDVIDVLQTTEGEWIFESPRIETPHTHGTGCTLASAISVRLATGQDMAASVDAARAYLMKAIEAAPGLGQGHGPVEHGWVIKQQPES